MSDIRTRLGNVMNGHLRRHAEGISPARMTGMVDVLLSLPDIAIVELPKAPWKWALGLGDIEDLYARDGLVIVSGIDAISPSYARDLAAGLLSAANAAEVTK